MTFNTLVIEFSHIIVAYASTCTVKRLNVVLIWFTLNCKFNDVVSKFFCLYVANIVNYVDDLKCFCNTCQIFLSIVLRSL